MALETLGIIPALAGNTPGRLHERPARWDHPRSRGEYPSPAATAHTASGSSPLSRGIPGLFGDRQRWRQDHPRSRGEYAPAADRRRQWGGSSPLSRGIRAPLWERSHSPGIIPALAGNTLCIRKLRSRNWDHPRSRGEYQPTERNGAQFPGSSPLSRGIPAARELWWWGIGIIPALAGNTRKDRSRHMRTWDHPRSRGEYATPLARGPGTMGSSPLSRGIRHSLRHDERRRGIIPALAGNTWRRSAL